MIKVPRVMSTQHPDNVNSPFFSQNEVMGGEDEIKEAFFAFSHLGCREQMWDAEGKEVDSFVIKKLLTRYESFFRKNVIGRDFFITLRVPNPEVEKPEAKVLIETLESIPRSYDIAKLFYGDDVPPIFEVILPMTTSTESLNRIYHYYREFICGKQHRNLPDDIKIREWIGEFRPEKINVIPLIEEKERMINSDQIVRDYLEGKDLEYQRVFLARSDPAENYGLMNAVLINKIALQRLHGLEEETGTRILPIIGVGSVPFRGNFNPPNLKNCLKEYPSVHTFTAQPSFKYDHTEREVTGAVDTLNSTKRGKPDDIDEDRIKGTIGKVSDEYQKCVKMAAPWINMIAKYVPARRKRKLHIGLFGYSRSTNGVTLPRAIKFCASLYSIGLPPEILGLNVLTEKEIEYVKDIYHGFDNDLKRSLPFFNRSVLKILPPEVAKGIEKSLGLVDHETNEKHREITEMIINDLSKNNFGSMTENITQAAWIRRFLG